MIELNIHSFSLVAKEENTVAVYNYMKVLNTKEGKDIFRIDQSITTSNGMKLRNIKPWNIFLRDVLVKTLENVLYGSILPK